jgi:hypothetical protein
MRPCFLHCPRTVPHLRQHRRHSSLRRHLRCHRRPKPSRAEARPAHKRVAPSSSTTRPAIATSLSSVSAGVTRCSVDSSRKRWQCAHPTPARRAGIICNVRRLSRAYPTSSSSRVLWVLFALACTAGPPPAAQQPWTGFFHPPPKPGASIDTKQCTCRACDPGSCCQAEETESLAAASSECSSGYEFSEKCGIVVQSCTPRCYSHVWRVKNHESCDATKPLVCCG